MPDTLVTTYLEMRRRSDFQPAWVDVPDAQIIRLGRVDVAFYRFLYSEVGAAWRWRDRAALDDTALNAALAPARVDVLYVAGCPAGYAELAVSDAAAGDVELAYFGLRGDFIGRGLGKHLLSHAIQSAWDDETTRRLWLHTCNLDSPHAIDNYIKRGFGIYQRTEEPMPAHYR
ncbi:MAG: GNAT family N-acetyltransferase [Anaerolineaceae bacterium]|nr:MAG: GNAT family N-acetyltransferase [Anaerolineaceae bacterium]